MSRTYTTQALEGGITLAKSTVWKWTGMVASICLAPLVIMVLGIDFSSYTLALQPPDTVGMTVAELSDAAHRALHGSFTHTLPEWSAFCAALFVVRDSPLNESRTTDHESPGDSPGARGKVRVILAHVCA